MEKILFVDDEPDLCELGGMILTKAGYEVLTAQDGAAALRLAKEKDPGIIILDYLLPGENGIAVCKKLKAEPATKAIPVIMMTAYAEQKEESLSAGAIDFIVKPMEKADLLLRIGAALRIRNISDELQRMIAYTAELDKAREN